MTIWDVTSVGTHGSPTSEGRCPPGFKPLESRGGQDRASELGGVVETKALSPSRKAEARLEGSGRSLDVSRQLGVVSNLRVEQWLRGDLELYGQANKRIRWMPWRSEAMKDVAACDKPRGVGSKR